MITEILTIRDRVDLLLYTILGFSIGASLNHIAYCLSYTGWQGGLICQ